MEGHLEFVPSTTAVGKVVQGSGQVVGVGCAIPFVFCSSKLPAACSPPSSPLSAVSAPSPPYCQTAVATYPPGSHGRMASTQPHSIIPGLEVRCSFNAVCAPWELELELCQTMGVGEMAAISLTLALTWNPVRGAFFPHAEWGKTSCWVWVNRVMLLNLYTNGKIRTEHTK